MLSGALSDDESRSKPVELALPALGTPPAFYWFCLWFRLDVSLIAPAVAIKEKDRPLLDHGDDSDSDTGANKPCLGWTRHAWDRCFWNFLAGIAVATQRWLGRVTGAIRAGFAAEKLSSSNKLAERPRNFTPQQTSKDLSARKRRACDPVIFVTECRSKRRMAGVGDAADGAAHTRVSYWHSAEKRRRYFLARRRALPTNLLDYKTRRQEPRFCY